ncbi:MAG TPA: DUF3047 domain-containing protein [Bryobacteraceae bacterium]
MKKFILIPILVSAFVAQTEPLAMVVLSTAGRDGGRIPAGWEIKVNHGKPVVSVCKDVDTACLHLLSVKASFSLEKAVDVDPAQMPYLTWSWKVAQLPGGGDFRKASTDDQAAQLLVAFSDRRVLSYIWDTAAPKGAMESVSSIPLLRVVAVVCESGVGRANQWIAESRNVAADYERAYGKAAPRVKGLRIQVNSQHTGTVAESYFGEVAFRSTPQ